MTNQQTDTYPRTWDNLNGAANYWVPRQIEGMGGWQAAVATIGIRDLASTWPKSMVERYDREGIPMN